MADRIVQLSDDEAGPETAQTARCRKCRAVLEFVTDGMGRVIERCPTCTTRVSWSAESSHYSLSRRGSIPPDAL